MRFLRIRSWCMLAIIVFLGLSEAQQDNIFNQEEPSSPPTSQFQGPESGYIVPIPEGNGPQVNQDRVVDFSYCYGALASHDINSNQRMERAEFENFAQDFGSATECLGELEEIPLELILVWNQLSCECRVRGGGPECCLGNNANIPITGVNPNDRVIVEEQQFLRQVCLRTDQAIVTYCGPPPPPIIPPPPELVLEPSIVEDNEPLIAGLVLAGIFLLLPWRRRFFFRRVYKEEYWDEESEDGGGMRHLITETGGEDDPPPTPVPLLVPPPQEEESIIEEFIDEPMDESVEEVTIFDEEETYESYEEEVIEEGDYGEPNDTAMLLQSTGEEEDGAYGGTTYGRTIEEPEYEEEGDPLNFVYEQYETPQDPEVPIVLAPIPIRTRTTEDEPYDLEHYVPDGGVVQYEREGAWRYDADGGWVPDERGTRQADDWNHAPYQRAAAVAGTPDSRRRERTLQAYEGGEVFDLLDQYPTETRGGRSSRMFNWVIQSTLNALDQRAGSIQGSDHSTSSSSGRGRR